MKFKKIISRYNVYENTFEIGYYLGTQFVIMHIIRNYSECIAC